MRGSGAADETESAARGGGAPQPGPAAAGQNVWEANYLDSAQTRKLFEGDDAEYRSILGELGMVKQQ